MTSKVEWFRRTTWTKADAAEFAQRLARARGNSQKAQYLRIQAVHLFDVGKPDLVLVALGLLEQLFADFPDPFQLSAAYSLHADCLVDLGRPDAALQSYERSLTARRNHAGIQDDSYLSYGELILALRRTSLYRAALAAIDEFGGSTPFPVQQYRLAAIRARLTAASGDGVEARRWARIAIAAAAQTESPFRFHRALGVVNGVDPLAHEQLVALAES
jgi:tetratricopeptide (TPR) repeat protein